MQKKIIPLILIALLVGIPVVLQVGGILELVSSSLNIVIISGYMLLVMALFVISARIAKKIEDQKPTETVRIIHKNTNDLSASDDKKVSNKKDEETARYIAKMVKEITEGVTEAETTEKKSERILKNLANKYKAVQAVSFMLSPETETYTTSATYAFYSEETEREFKNGEGLTGQVAKNQKFLYIDNVPENYIKILSGLGNGTPKYLILFPIIHNDKTIGVVEFATFSQIPRDSEQVFEKLKDELGQLISV